MSSANHLYFMSSANGLYFTSSANGRISRGRPRGMMLNWLRRWHEGITSTELNPVNQGLKYVESHGRLYHLVRHMMMMFSADMSNTFCIFLLVLMRDLVSPSVVNTSAFYFCSQSIFSASLSKTTSPLPTVSSLANFLISVPLLFFF